MQPPLLVDVLVPRSGKDSIFTYVVPDEMAESIDIGHVVTVPIRQRHSYGIVWNRIGDKQKNASYQFRPIKKIVHLDLKLLPHIRELGIWMSEYYMAPVADCIFTMIPILKKPPKGIDQSIISPEGFSKLAQAGTAKFELTHAQSMALTLVKKSTKPILLHGVTGSGKTEVYLQRAGELLAEGKQVLILVPEIALTPQTKKRFSERFGNIVDVWHSDLAAAERREIFWKVYKEKIRLVVGSRSALFLPFKKLGMIAIDEEHEKSYYQESSPRYNTRTVAEKLCKLTGAQLVLGSATPSLESVWKASTNHYALATMQNRVTEHSLPESLIIDLRQEQMQGDSFISYSLLQQLTDTLKQERQAVLLLNRRGHATSALCTTCGTILLCRNCNIPLTVHHADGSQNPTLQCHHCNHHELLSSICPVCKSSTLNTRGIGTEKVESQLQELLPSARILRMDRDTTASRNIIDQMYHDFANHGYDILVGTQMIAKGWDIPRVDLVGVLLAEGGLMLPDYHAAETTFNLLVQVSGRSGRGGRPGLTVFQTYQPDHPLIQAAAKHNFSAFVKNELKNRKAFHYPPFSHIVRLLYQHRDKEKCLKEIVARTVLLSNQLGSQQGTILGPSPCFFDRLRGKYRYHTIIKVMDKSTLDYLRTVIKELRPPWVVEIDPPQML